MKSLMTALALIISSVSYAADSLKVRQTEPELSDIYVALESLGITMYRFDLKDFLSARYNVSVYVDEFADGEKTSGSHEFSLGTNIESLKGFDETEQDYIRKRYDIPEDSYEWNRITDITIHTCGQDDSSAFIIADIAGAGRCSFPVKRYPTGPDSTYFYHSRPFSFNGIQHDSTTVSIPLVLYGSGWYDQEHNLVRFCGEEKIDPEMQAEILGYIPHYYIVYLKMTLCKEDEKNTLSDRNMSISTLCLKRPKTDRTSTRTADTFYTKRAKRGSVIT